MVGLVFTTRKTLNKSDLTLYHWCLWTEKDEVLKLLAFMVSNAQSERYTFKRAWPLAGVRWFSFYVCSETFVCYVCVVLLHCMQSYYYYHEY